LIDEKGSTLFFHLLPCKKKLQAFLIAQTAHLCVHNQQTHIPTDRAIARPFLSLPLLHMCMHGVICQLHSSV